VTSIDDEQVRRLRAAASEPTQGDVVDDRFELTEVIGEGGMGLVWSAWDRDTERNVAIKIVHGSADAVDRLQREAQAVARVSHPAIVRTLAVGSAGGVRYVAMDLLEGCTLADRLAGSLLPIQGTIELGHRIAGALAALHAEGLVHRDVKPANLFLVGGATASAHLLDFGLIKGVEGPNVTKTGALVGTPGYMAPEQVRGERDVGPRADVFALGCVVFECVTGQPPFRGETDEALFSRILLEQAPPLGELRAETPSWLGDLVARMLRKDAADRPDARDVAIAMERGASTQSEAGATQQQGFAQGRVVAGRYRIERVIGEGGMGIVLAARHLELGKLVALKVLRKRGNAVEEARFLREARAAARLENEHVARVLDAGRVDEDTPFIAMELLEGEDLAQHMKSRGPLPVQEAVVLVLEACEAIAEAHAMGVIHRDIKPSNLFLASRRDGSRLVKVLDFGISKVTRALDGATGDSRSMTATASALGSAWYMSPEQLQDAKHVDARSDIWSIGVVLHELLTGQPPFGGENAAAVGARIATASPPALRSLRGDVPAGLERVVLCCLEKDPVRRYADVGALARALAPYAAPEAEVTAARTSRTSILWSVAIGLGIMVIVALAVMRFQATDGGDHAGPDSKPAPSSSMAVGTTEDANADSGSLALPSTSAPPLEGPPALASASTRSPSPRITAPRAHASRAAPVPARSSNELNLLHPALDGR
jgi:serine/threonine-protein kinase